jgi:hypothetical protein
MSIQAQAILRSLTADDCIVRSGDIGLWMSRGVTSRFAPHRRRTHLRSSHPTEILVIFISAAAGGGVFTKTVHSGTGEEPLLIVARKSVESGLRRRFSCLHNQRQTEIDGVAASARRPGKAHDSGLQIAAAFFTPGSSGCLFPMNRARAESMWVPARSVSFWSDRGGTTQWRRMGHSVLLLEC